MVRVGRRGASRPGEEGLAPGATGEPAQLGITFSTHPDSTLLSPGTLLAGSVQGLAGARPLCLFWNMTSDAHR